MQQTYIPIETDKSYIRNNQATIRTTSKIINYELARFGIDQGCATFFEPRPNLPLDLDDSPMSHIS